MKAKMQDGGLFLTAENAMEAQALAKLTLDQHAHSLNIDGQNLSISEVDVQDSEEHEKARSEAAFSKFQNESFAQGRSEYLQGQQPAAAASNTARTTRAGTTGVASPATSFGAGTGSAGGTTGGSPTPPETRGSELSGTPSAANPTGRTDRQVGMTPEERNSYYRGGTSPGTRARTAGSTANAADMNLNVTGQTDEAQDAAMSSLTKEPESAPTIRDAGGTVASSNQGAANNPTPGGVTDTTKPAGATGTSGNTGTVPNAFQSKK
jgi:hypothetical protein